MKSARTFLREQLELKRDINEIFTPAEHRWDKFKIEEVG